MIAFVLWGSSSAIASLRPDPFELFGVSAPSLRLSGLENESLTQSVAAPDSPQGQPLRGEGRYIVVLKDSIKHPGAVAENQAEEVGGDVNLVYRSALKGYATTMPKDEVDALAEDPRIKYVTPDRKVKALAQETPTGIARIGASGNESLGIDGEDNLRVNADVAVIDTGIDYTHPDLDVVARTNCVPDDFDFEAQECIDGTGIDGHSHGTHVAGTIAALDNGIGVTGVAPGARLWAVKVLDDEGSGYFSWIIAGVDWVTAHADQIEVANMSLGGRGADPALDEAIEASAEAGIVYTVAAGNSNADAKEFSPANNPDVITVSALADYDGKSGGKSLSTCHDFGPDDTLASFSNYGKDVEVAAPGVCIRSTVPGGYATYSGTSMASPHVAGAAAILASQNNPTDLEDVESIRDEIEEEGSSAWTDTSGDGVSEPLLDLTDEEAFSASDRVVDTGSVTVSSSSEVTLHGEINPNGEKVQYRFEYGTSIAYGNSAPIPNGEVGPSSGYTPVSQTVGSLSGQTLYHYRLIAITGAGTKVGTDRTFGTSPPTIEAGSAIDVNTNFATLAATLDPEGFATNYYFEFGRSKEYGSRTATRQMSGAGPQEITELVGGIDANSTYHYRIVATNLAGTVHGEDRTFTTGPAQWALESPPALESENGVPDESLSAVSCLKQDFCMNVGWAWTEVGPGEDPVWENEYPMAESWDGDEWSAESIPDRRAEHIFDYLEDVSCPSEDWCAAAGVTANFQQHEVHSLLEIWDGDHWTIDQGVSEIPNAVFLHSVSCSSPSDCMAVGVRRSEASALPLALEWDGTDWSEVSMPDIEGGNPGIAQGISCAASNACVAVGYTETAGTPQGAAWEYDGTKWVAYPPLDVENVHSISCVPSSESSPWCIGLSFNEAFTLEDGEWSSEPLPQPAGTLPGVYYYSADVSCVAKASCVATGFYMGSRKRLSAAVFSLSGDGWEVQSTVDPGSEVGPGHLGTLFSGVSCSEASRCTAVGSRETDNGKLLTLIERFVRPPALSPSFAEALGTQGSGAGQFRVPYDVAVDSGGNLWVVDDENNRIQKFNSKGEYLSQFGSQGTGNGEFEYPVGIAIDSKDNLWITDLENNRIQKFNSKGEYLSQFGSQGTGNGEFEYPSGIAIDSKDNLWITDFENNRIQEFNSKGEYLSQFGSKGDGNGELVEPGDIAVDAGDHLWVVDSRNNRIQEFNSKGEYLSQFGSEGNGDGEFNVPFGIGINAAGAIWVADTYNHRIQIFNSKGEYLSQFGSEGDGDGEFFTPLGIAFDAGGDAWIADTGNNRIQRWTP